MTKREIDVDREIGRHVNENKGEISKQIDIMLAYGSVNLGLSNIVRRNDLDERIKEDLGLKE